MTQSHLEEKQSSETLQAKSTQNHSGQNHWSGLLLLLQAALIMLVMGFTFLSVRIWDSSRSSQTEFWIALLMIVTGALILLEIIIYCVYKSWHAGTYIAALVVAAPIMPSFATIITVLIFCRGYPPLYAIPIGIISALLIWMIIPLFCHTYVTPDHCYPHIFYELTHRRIWLESKLPYLVKMKTRYELQQASLEERATICSAIYELELQLNSLAEKCKDSHLPEEALSWIVGSGYINMRECIHRAEEALIDVESTAQVISYARIDQDRLRGSRIPNAEGLQGTLLWAINQLDSKITDQCFHNHAPTELLKNSTTDPVVEQVSSNSVASGLLSRSLQEAEARAFLRQIRHTINTYRDERRYALVRARNSLLRTGIFTGVSVYILLTLALLNEANSDIIVAGAAFYMSGAIVGLFKQLHSETRKVEANEDYGFSTARLLHIPLFSGLAAIGGVILVSLLPLAASITPTANNSLEIEIATLSEIFNLGQHPFGLVIAAVFGLTPSLLIDRLHLTSDQLVEDLRNTSSAGTDNQARSTNLSKQ